MPVLPITDGEGRLSMLAPSMVEAIMTYPEPDDPRQMQFFSKTIAGLLVEHPELYEERGREVLALEVLPHVYSAPRPRQVVQEGKEHAGKSWIAGELLLFLLNVAAVRPEERVSISKGLSVLREVLEAKPTLDGGVVGFTLRTGWNAWSRFKPVAHFHAVLQMSMQNATLDLGPNRGPWEVPPLDYLPEFMAFAEHLQALGLESSFLDPETTWRIPEDLRLPPATIEFPPLPQTALQALDDYIPEGSQAGPPIP